MSNFTLLPYDEEDDFDPHADADEPITICTKCGETCTTYTVDERFDYEYGDIRGTHGEVYHQSSCCDADIKIK